jgi:hypothetical protein
MSEETKPWWSDVEAWKTLVVTVAIAACGVVLVVRGEYEIAIPVLLGSGAIPFTRALRGGK